MVAAVLWFLASATSVDLAGYWLHRWAHRPSSPLYKAHMTHHVVHYPARDFFSTKYRSARSDSLALWFAPFGLAYALIVLLVGFDHTTAILLGGAATAVASSVLHDKTHISGSVVWHTWGLRGIAVRHHSHHFKMRRNFGIISPVWDVLFRTRKPRVRSSQGRTPPYDR